MSAEHEQWMRAAIELARAAGSVGEVPVGALVVRGGDVVARAANATIRENNPAGHAEIIALTAAGRRLGDWRLHGCTLYVTLEPCAMCAGALVLSRLDSVVFGAWDAKAGMAGSIGDILRHPRLNHTPQVRGGVLEHECGALLTEFFRDKRDVQG